MIFRKLILNSLLLSLCCFACDSSDERPEAEMGTLSLSNAQYEPVSLDSALRVGDRSRSTLELTALWNTEPLTTANWSTADEMIATVSVDEAGQATVEAKAAGETEITVSYKNNEASMMIQVIELTALKVTGPERDLKPSDQFTLGVKAIWSDETTEALDLLGLDSVVTWTSENDFATVSDTGEVSIIGFGSVSIKAEMQLANDRVISGTWAVEVPCTYPAPSGRNFNTDLEIGTVLPPIKWGNAYSAMDGTISPLSMEEVYCSADYDWVKTINFLISAGWCTACPAHLRAVRDMSEELREAGGLLVYVEVQDNVGEPADSLFAWEHLSELLGPTQGYFVGDKEIQPLTRFFGRSPAIQAFPDAYVVRRSDMHILTSLDLNRSVGVLPLIRIAEQPNEDWSTIMPPPFESTCVDGDEEASEPNDTPDVASVLEVGSHSGAICSEEPDYYQINLEGAWTFSINFSHAEADIDIFQYAIGQSEGDPVAISNGTSDMESINGEGPAVIGIVSFTRTSASYNITLEAR